MTTTLDDSMQTEHYRIPAGNRLVTVNRQGSKVWANLWVNAGRGIAHADITTLRWTGKTISGALTWARKQLWHSKGSPATWLTQWPFLNAYTLTSAEHFSHNYGPCQVCKKYASEVFVQAHLVLRFHYPYSENREGPPSPIYTAAPAFFGHEQCLIKIRNHDLHPFYVADH